MKKIIKENRMLLFIIVLIFIIASGIILLSYNKRSKELNNKEIDLKNQSEEGLKIEYDLSKIIDENNIKILIKFKSESGINEIIFPNEENIIYGNGKNSIVIDYTAANGIDYNFKVTDVNGNELEKIINVTPYDIYKIEDLENMDKGSDKSNYRLMNDLDFKSKDSYRTEEKYNYYNLDANNDGTPDNSWTPIGSTSSAFKGNFDGQNHTISNLYINTTQNYSGLFGYVYSNYTTFKNIKLQNVNINAKYYVGALAGEFRGGTINNVFIDNVNIKSSGSDIGGIVGAIDWGTIQKVKVTNASITGSSEIGGIVGYSSAESTLTIDQAVFSGSLYGSYSGGIIGYKRATNVKIYNSRTEGYSKSAGISGYTTNSIVNSYTTMKVGSYPIAIVSDNTEGVFWNSSTAGVSSSRYGTPKTTDELQQVATFAGWDTSIWNIEDGKYPTLKWEE